MDRISLVPGVVQIAWKMLSGFSSESNSSCVKQNISAKDFSSSSFTTAAARCAMRATRVNYQHPEVLDAEFVVVFFLAPVGGVSLAHVVPFAYCRLQSSVCCPFLGITAAGEGRRCWSAVERRCRL